MQLNRQTLIAAALVLALLLIAFGRAPAQPDRGNTLYAAMMAPPDSLDTAMSYQGVVWRMFVNTNNGLLTYPKAGHPTGSSLVPDLAERMPTMSRDGKEYIFQLRRGVMWSPPLTREVLPSDIKNAIERLFRMASPGYSSYLIIEGSDRMEAKKAKEISGLVADDEARTLTVRLTQPDPTILFKLAMPFSFAVPKELPDTDQTTKGLMPATGPYMFKSYDTNRRIVLVRNPNFRQWSEHTPTGFVDGIDIQIGVSPDNATTKIKRGDLDYNFEGPPKQQLNMLLGSDEYKDQIYEEESAVTSYIWMNTQEPPFDNVKVRQAVNWAIDRRALVKLSGGVAAPSENILPPVMPGYVKHDLYPGPNLAKARQLIAESGIRPGKIDFWCRQNPEGNATSQYFQDVLNNLGFSTSLKCVDPSAYYTMVGNIKTKALIGTGSWGQDFPEGSNFIDVLLNGKRITPQHNMNMAQFDDAGVNKAIEETNKLLDLKERAKRWAEIDRKIAELAPWAPLTTPKSLVFVSDRVSNHVQSPVYESLFMLIRLDGKGAPNPALGEEGDGEASEHHVTTDTLALRRQSQLVGAGE